MKDAKKPSFDDVSAVTSCGEAVSSGGGLLRAYCVELAIKALAASDTVAVMPLAEAIYQFISDGKDE